MTFQESEHPRLPAGTTGGGQFTFKDEVKYKEVADEGTTYKKLGAKFWAEMTDEELVALSGYTGNRYEEVNSYYRTGVGTSIIGLKTSNDPSVLESVQKTSKGLDSAEQHGQLPADYAVFRGVTPKMEARLQEMAVGGTILDKGYMSTTFRSESSRRFSRDNDAQMKILLPKGTKGIFASVPQFGDTQLKREQEFVLPRDSKLRYLGSRKVGQKDLHAQARQYVFELV